MSSFTDKIQNAANRYVQKKAEIDSTSHEYWQQSVNTLEQVNRIVEQVTQEFASADPRIKSFRPTTSHLSGILLFVNHHIFAIHCLAMGQHVQVLSMKDPQMTPTEIYAQDFDKHNIEQKFQDALFTWFESAVQ